MSKEKKGGNPPRGGRPSKEKIRDILALAGKVPIAEIARRFGQREETIEKIIREHGGVLQAPAAVAPVDGGPAKSPRQVARQELRASEAWRHFSSQFSPDELRFFEEQYCSLMEQFAKDGVLASERLQVLDVVKLEILKNRNLTKRQRWQEEAEAIQAERAALLAGRTPRELEAEDAKTFGDLGRRLSALHAQDKDATQEYTSLLEKQAQTMKTLKSTRDQRVHEIESGKTTFVGLVKQLQQREVQEREARQAELMRLAAEKELRRLGAPHVYEDGSVDRPILSAETIAWEEEKGEGGSE